MNAFDAQALSSRAGCDSSLTDALLNAPLSELLHQSRCKALEAFGPVVTYSRKVFIPLTHLCRDTCRYCTFAKAPRSVRPFLSIDEVLEIARAGAAAGCREALFTLGERPEARYRVARSALTAMGHETTLSYLHEAAGRVLAETGLLPHLNPGLLDDTDYRLLRPVAASMGLMLETMADRLGERGGPHYGSPDKIPARRLAAIQAAGQAGVPFTTGLLIGIGETRHERIEALLAIEALHRRYGHIQEVIVQSFRAKLGTGMAGHPEPSLDEHLWTVAAARLILDSSVSIQTPPNLHTPDELLRLLDAGVNDWGGVSPVTPDHVNPEAPWPHLEALAATTSTAGRVLRERLAVGPAFAREAARWVDPQLSTRVLRSVDGRGLPYEDKWRSGAVEPLPAPAVRTDRVVSDVVRGIVDRACDGKRLSEADIVRLFETDGEDAAFVFDSADALRARTVGETVTYVVNRNITYTNICLYKCGFCGFSKGTSRGARGAAYQYDAEEISRRTAEAVARGATEVCLQGGIHPSFDGNTYLSILDAVRAASPNVHIHAFSPLEVFHGATTLGRSLPDYLGELKDRGLGTLPGTAAEILDDEIRSIICPDKLSTEKWLDVVRAAHQVGLRSTATIMFGHVEGYRHWARHLLAVRDLQKETGGFTEFVPLPFVHMEAPLWHKGRARSGPSAREVLLMHAVARLALHPLVPNIQASWVKLGPVGIRAALKVGVNDIGGTLMDESITRSAGGLHGQVYSADAMVRMATKAGRPARQRTTLYGTVGGY